MNEEQVNARIEKVTVSASKKVQLDRYEPIEEHASFTAEVREDDSEDNVAELLDALEERAWEQVERGVMERYETHVRKEDD